MNTIRELRARARDDDRGYVMVMMGLLIIPFIAFTAIAVDVSSWYSRASELQRAADAAALAGVIRMPSLPEAGTKAHESLSRNGFVPGTDDISVTTGYGDAGNSFRVCVTDSSVTQFFGAVIGSPTRLKRCATAQYNLPLEIGSPQNYFGGIRASTTRVNSDQNPGYWASIEALGTDAIQGDRFMPKCYGRGVVNSASDCNSYQNPEQSDWGHFYTLSIPKKADKMFLQVFSAAPNDTSITSDSNWNQNNWTVHYQLYHPDDTPWDVTDNVANPVSAATCGGGNDNGRSENTGSWSLGRTNTYSDFRSQWRTLCTLTNVGPTEEGKPYVLRVWATGDNANASNSFAIRATSTSSSGAVPTSNGERMPSNRYVLADQPALSAWEHMAITVNQNANNTGGKASFFLAKVGPEYAGKTLVIELYDSAEGSQSITVNDPDGPKRGCEWTSYPLKDGVNGFASGSNGAGGYVGSGNPPYPRSTNGDCVIPTRSGGYGGGTEYYNGRVVEIRIPIPPEYASFDNICDETVRPTSPTSGDQGCWWSITYQGTGTITDATTWSAHIEGDPVRLIE